MNLLSKTSDVKDCTITRNKKTLNKDGEVKIVIVTYTALEYASHTLQWIITDFQNPQTVIMFSQYGDISRMATPLHATVYMLDKIINKINKNFSRNITTLMAMILDIKNTKQAEECNLLRPAKRLVRDISRRMKDINKKIDEFEAFPKKKQLREGQQIYIASLLAEKQEIIENHQEYSNIENNIVKEYMPWKDFIDALEDNFLSACIMAIEQEMLEFLNTSQTNNYKVYQEIQRLEDMFEATFSKRDFNKIVYAHMCSRLIDMENNGRCEVLKPFGNTFIQMLTGKQPCKSYIIPGAEHTETVLSLLRDMRDLTHVFMSNDMTANIDKQLDELISHITCVKGAISKDNLNGICIRLNGISTIRYDLRYVIVFINKLLRSGIKETGNPVIIRSIKSWIIKQLMQYIQDLAIECVNYDHSQIKIVIDKYAVFAGKSIPWTHLFKSLSIFHDSVTAQVTQAKDICSCIDTYSEAKEKGYLDNKKKIAVMLIEGLHSVLGFGGLASNTSLTEKEKQKRKADRALAAKKYGEYLTSYNYIWNNLDFSDNFGSISKIPPNFNNISTTDAYMNYINKGSRTGEWDINHRSWSVDLIFMLKYNNNIADILKEFAPHQDSHQEGKLVVKENIQF